MKKNKICPSCRVSLIWPTTKQCQQCHLKELEKRSEHCRSCGCILTSENTYQQSKWRSNVCKQCTSKYHHERYLSGYGEKQKKSRQELKKKIIEHYGSRCSCCGETLLIFLVVDHIKGGGNKHKKEIGSLGHSLYKWLEKHNFPSGFQVLCHNCNYAKHHYKVCPHRLESQDA